MSDVKATLLTKYDLEIRALRCESEGRDFITLEPLQNNAKQIYHSELGRFVFVNKA